MPASSLRKEGMDMAATCTICRSMVAKMGTVTMIAMKSLSQNTKRSMKSQIIIHQSHQLVQRTFQSLQSFATYLSTS